MLLIVSELRHAEFECQGQKTLDPRCRTSDNTGKQRRQDSEHQGVSDVRHLDISDQTHPRTP